MRFSNVLFQTNMTRQIKKMWKKQGRLQAQELLIPPELREMGVIIKDVKEIIADTKMFPPPVIKKTSIPLAPSVFSKEKYFYVMHNQTHVSESENQVLSLTKTVPYRDLPKGLVSLVGVDSLPNQDHLVKTNLLQAQVWDGDQDKLPKIFDPDRPAYNFKRVYGTLYQKKVLSLLEKLSFLSDSATGKYLACLQRDKILDAFCDLSINRNSDSVTFQMFCDIVLTSSQPLKRFASPSLVAQTKNMEVPNIYPIKSTLDLDKLETKPVVSNIPNFNDRYIHTLLIAQKSYELNQLWEPRQMLAQAISTCFAYAAKQAKMKYGVNVGELPEPMAVQCVYMDIKSFYFLAYQLNTLELDNNDGIKNQVWMDEPVTLYEEISETNLISNYNPEVFAKMLAFHINGLQQSSV